MNLFIVSFVFLALTSNTVLAKTYDRCSLAKEMHALGVPKSDLPIWTCIAEHESTYRTNAVGRTNSNGTNDYGIFQINNKYWCKPSNGSKSYNECNVSCDDLLTDSIDKSVTCALKIKKQQGWKAWSTWKFCSGTLPSIDSCL